MRSAVARLVYLRQVRSGNFLDRGSSLLADGPKPVRNISYFTVSTRAEVRLAMLISPLPAALNSGSLIMFAQLRKSVNVSYDLPRQPSSKVQIYPADVAFHQYSLCGYQPGNLNPRVFVPQLGQCPS